MHFVLSIVPCSFDFFSSFPASSHGVDIISRSSWYCICSIADYFVRSVISIMYCQFLIDDIEKQSACCFIEEGTGGIKYPFSDHAHFRTDSGRMLFIFLSFALIFYYYCPFCFVEGNPDVFQDSHKFSLYFKFLPFKSDVYLYGFVIKKSMPMKCCVLPSLRFLRRPRVIAIFQSK